MNIRENRGITLIILIVTIVVLLILSGITISTITNGESTGTQYIDTKFTNKTGLYDTVEKEFYLNAGSGEFIRGPEDN